MKRTYSEQMQRYKHMMATAERQLMAAVTIGDNRRAVRATGLIDAIVRRIKAQLEARDPEATHH